ncbi:MAG: 3-hydroxyacyl-ACP dehydratase FabZ [Planctomycetota bacterium]
MPALSQETKSAPNASSNGKAAASANASRWTRRTLAQPIVVEGPGLFTGKQVKLRLAPARGGDGIFFVRDNAEPQPARPRRLAASLDRLEIQPRHTVLAGDRLRVETVEHLLAGLASCGITDAEVGLDADESDESYEVPMGDGSSSAFVQAVQDAGVEELESEIKPLVVTDTVQVMGESGASVVALPGPSDALEIVYTFEADEPLGRQVVSLRVDWGQSDNAALSELADARTFIFEGEAEALKAHGWGGHLTHKDLLVIGDQGPIDNAFRWPDEPARHKALDLLGDLALLGRPVCGRIIAHRSGHALNHELAKALAAHAEASPSIDEGPLQPRDELDEVADLLLGEAPPAMDAKAIQRILPHRFPMLLVDRVLKFVGDRRAIGVKNVTMGDVFFLGHYPTRPIFPGVLIVEAMGQLGGILLSRKLEHTGKIAILLSMDRVKLRHAVTPGDQLILVADAVRIKSRYGQVRCTAYIGRRLAAEAEIKFMLSDAESE